MNSNRKKIAIVLPDLRGGGAEKMHLPLASFWLSKGYDVDFVLMNKRGELLDQVPSGAGVISLDTSKARATIMPLKLYLLRERPNVLLAAMWPLTVTAVAAARLSKINIKVVLSEHNNLSAQYAGWGLAHAAAMRFSMALAYRLADRVIAVSKGVANDLSRLSFLRRERFSVIYNPAAVRRIEGGIGIPTHVRDGEPPLVLSVGALKSQKNQALLIRAFALVLRAMPARLRILGEGELRSDLEALVSKLGLEDAVSLPGFVTNPSTHYDEASVFALSSSYEGFGNVIVEALESGVPIVSTDCISGPREILADGEFGTLVPLNDEVALADGILAALHCAPDRAVLRARAEEFSVSKISEEYLTLFEGIS